jgi:hypothetical protein
MTSRVPCSIWSSTREMDAAPKRQTISLVLSYGSGTNAPQGRQPLAQRLTGLGQFLLHPITPPAQQRLQLIVSVQVVRAASPDDCGHTGEAARDIAWPESWGHDMVEVERVGTAPARTSRGAQVGEDEEGAGHWD